MLHLDRCDVGIIQTSQRIIPAKNSHTIRICPETQHHTFTRTGYPIVDDDSGFLDSLIGPAHI